MIATTNEILRQRALLLSRKESSSTRCSEACTTMLQFVIAQQTYAIDAVFVKEILTIDAIVPIPGLKQVVRGIVNVRGKIVAIFNLDGLLGIQSETDNQSRVVVLKDTSTGVEFGIQIKDILQTKSVLDEAIKGLPHHITGALKRILKGVTIEGVLIIEAKELIKDAVLSISTMQSRDESL